MPKTATRFLTRREAARRLNVAVATLESWVFRGKGPAYIRTGKRRGKTLYAVEELERWEREHTISPGKKR